MNATAIVTDVRFTRAPHALRADGLLGWALCTLDDKYALDAIVVRRTQQGEIEFFFPSHRSERGREHEYFRPLTPALRNSILRQVREQLEAKGLP